MIPYSITVFDVFLMFAVFIHIVGKQFFSPVCHAFFLSVVPSQAPSDVRASALDPYSVLVTWQVSKNHDSVAWDF